MAINTFFNSEGRKLTSREKEIILIQALEKTESIGDFEKRIAAIEEITGEPYFKNTELHLVPLETPELMRYIPNGKSQRPACRKIDRPNPPTFWESLMLQLGF